jgi:hypothetical protein
MILVLIMFDSGYYFMVRRHAADTVAIPATVKTQTTDYVDPTKPPFSPSTCRLTTFIHSLYISFSSSLSLNLQLPFLFCRNSPGIFPPEGGNYAAYYYSIIVNRIILVVLVRVFRYSWMACNN